MCKVRSREKTVKNKSKNIYIMVNIKKMDYDEPHLPSNEKTHILVGGQNDPLVHWWVMVDSSPLLGLENHSYFEFFPNEWAS
jgi:hypothetical protein